MNEFKAVFESPKQQYAAGEALHNKNISAETLIADASVSAVQPQGKQGGVPNERQVSVGQIENISIPTQWSESNEGDQSVPLGGFREFDRDDNPNISLCFYNRGLKLSDSDAVLFHTCLTSPQHTLTLQELINLKTALRDRFQPGFTVDSARTIDIQGKRVLSIEGTYNSIKERTKSLLVDADGSGHSVQEIYYQASRTVYSKFLPEAERAFRSIEWHK